MRLTVPKVAAKPSAYVLAVYFDRVDTKGV